DRRTFDCLLMSYNKEVSAYRELSRGVVERFGNHGVPSFHTTRGPAKPRGAIPRLLPVARDHDRSPYDSIRCVHFAFPWRSRSGGIIGCVVENGPRTGTDRHHVHE